MEVGFVSVVPAKSIGVLTCHVKDGELVDLIDEFSEGKVQFGFAKVRDPNTALPKNVLIAWCGEGVPERTKGYFTSHLSAVSRVLHVRFPEFPIYIYIGSETIPLITMACRDITFRSPVVPMVTLLPRVLYKKLQIRQVPSIPRQLNPPRSLQLLNPPLRASLFSRLPEQVAAVVGRACLRIAQELGL